MAGKWLVANGVAVGGVMAAGVIDGIM